MTWRAIIWCFVLSLFASASSFATVPANALRYQRDLTREAYAVWGLNAPVAAMASQIAQESSWRPDVCSSFACGLAQFTPATAEWISGAYSAKLDGANPMNPQWALRALVLYDRRIYDGIAGARDECERWAMLLSGYNGGPGWLSRDRELCRLDGHCDPRLWFGNVERFTARNPGAAAENRAYPRRILLYFQPQYAQWGGVISCSASHN